MIDVGIDFSAAEEASKIQPLPEDDYTLQIEKVEEREAKTSGRPMLNWTLSVVNAEDPKHNGRKIFYNTMLPYRDDSGELITKGVGFLVDFVKASGQTWEGTSLDPESLVGNTLGATIGIKEYQGKLNNEIKKVYAQ